MTDWARSTIAKTRMWTSAVKAAEQQAEANFGTHREPRPTATNLVAGWEVGMACAVVGCWHSRKIRWCGAQGYLLRSFNRCARADL